MNIHKSQVSAYHSSTADKGYGSLTHNIKFSNIVLPNYNAVVGSTMLLQQPILPNREHDSSL